MESNLAIAIPKFIKLTQAGEEFYINIDKIDFLRGRTEETYIRFGDDYAIVDETVEQVMEMINGVQV